MKILDISKVFQVEEFGFDGRMYGFHITIIAPGTRWDAFMHGSESGYDGLDSVSGSVSPVAADEFRTVVRLCFHAFQFDSTVFQMLTKNLSKQTSIVGALFMGIAQKHQTAADFPAGELIFG